MSDDVKLPPAKQYNKRLNGVVYTPLEVANPLTKLALEKINIEGASILEPSVGDGFFVSAAHSSAKNAQVLPSITAIDLDVETIEILKKFFDEVNIQNVTIVNADFLDFYQNSTSTFDLIIGNPPFIRKHEFSARLRENTIRLSESSGYDLKDLKNSWASFVVASEGLLTEHGCLTFILPYEILTVNYGQKIQDFLCEKFHRVDIYIPKEKAFKEIDQDAVAVVAQKRKLEEPGLYLHSVESLTNLTPNHSYAQPNQNNESKIITPVSFLLEPDEIEIINKIQKSIRKVGDFCSTSPGIVTAANDYFILNQSDVEKYNLEKWAHKILKKGSFLPKSPVFKVEDFEEISKSDKPAYFLYLKEDLINRIDEDTLNYIQIGEEKNINLRYKCRNRKVWYEVPYMPPTEGFFFKRSHIRPRLVVNEALTLTTDTAYRIRCNSGVEIKCLCFSFYNSVSLLFAEILGRFYGGGVLEITPKEFRNIPLFYKTPNHQEFEDFVAVHSEKIGTLTSDIEHFGNVWLERDFQFQRVDIGRIHSALCKIRSHRLRHGASS